MRAAVIDRFGGPGVVRVAEVPTPEPKPGEVRVRVRVAGINPIDHKMRAGGQFRFLRWVRRFPMVLGHEFAGTVDACGEGVTGFPEGMRVLGVANVAKGEGGAYAEFACVPATQVCPIPDGVSFEDASTLPIAGVSAWQSLFELGQARKGGSVLLLGASGGVGTFVVQLAKTHGIPLVAVCSGRNADVVRALGAPEVVDYTQQDPLALPGPFRAVIDATGTYHRGRARRLLVPDGRLVEVVGSNAGTLFDWLWTSAFSKKQVKVLFARPTLPLLQDLLGRVASGELKPLVSERFPLEKASEAHARLASGRTVGKVVITLDEAAAQRS